GRRRSVDRDLFYRFRVAVERHTLVPGFLQPVHHVRAHSSQANHSQLHRSRSWLFASFRIHLSRYDNACATAACSFPSPAFTFLPRCTRSARLPRSASTAKSPRACAALTTPKVYFCPGTATSFASSHVICRKTPLFGPPL